MFRAPPPHILSTAPVQFIQSASDKIVLQWMQPSPSKYSANLPLLSGRLWTSGYTGYNFVNRVFSLFPWSRSCPRYSDFGSWILCFLLCRVCFCIYATVPLFVLPLTLCYLLPCWLRGCPITVSSSAAVSPLLPPSLSLSLLTGLGDGRSWDKDTE